MTPVTNPARQDDSSAVDRPGRLTMTDAVFEKIALRASLGVDGAVRHNGSVTDKIGSFVGRGATAGSDYPRVRVEAAGGKAHVIDLSIAVRWPSAVSDVCRQVRTRIADELERLTGGRPVRVDVTVAAVVPDAGVRRRARGFVALPDSDRAATAANGPDEAADPSTPKEMIR